MEISFTPLEIAKEIKQYITNLKTIDDSLKKPFLNNIDKIINDSHTKINFIFFGNVSSGKTTSINLLIQHLNKNSNKANDSQSNDLNVSLPTSITENTYCFTFIENSQDENYHIQLKVHCEKNKKAFRESKEFKNEEFNKLNEINKIFKNNQEGIEDLQEFLNKIDNISLDLLEFVKREEFSQEKPRINPILTIKIPNFLVKYRIVDTPKLNLKNLCDNFNRFNEFNYINFLIFVRDIGSKEVYNIEDEIVKNLNTTFGKPFVYTLLTKGKKFLDSYSEITRENQRDYQKFLEINNKSLKNLKGLKFPDTFFRKMILLEDQISNSNVMKNMENFWNDIESALQKYGISSYEHSIDRKLRKYLSDLNQIFENNNALNEENKRKKSEDLFIKAHKDFEKKLLDYMNKFSSFEDYEKSYPDHVKKIECIFDRNENKVNNYWNRKNYIENHTKLAYIEFKNVVLDSLNKTMKVSISNFRMDLDEDLDEDLGCSLEDKSNDELSEIIFSPRKKQDLIRGILFFSAFIFSLNISSSLIFSSERIRKISSIVAIGVIVIGFSKSLGIWEKANTKKEIIQELFNALLNEKQKIIEKYKKIFSYSCKKSINQSKDINKNKEDIKNLWKIIYKLKPITIESSDFGFKEEEFLQKIENENLKKFFSQT